MQAKKQSTIAASTGAQANQKQPPQRQYVFAKNCTNTHGTFKKGDNARGAFSTDLIDAYLQAGILVKPASGQAVSDV